jgi:hypothetical protein
MARTRKGSSNGSGRPALKIATDAAPNVHSASASTAVGAAPYPDSTSPDINTGLFDADSPSGDIGSDTLPIGIDSVSSSSVPSDMWIALRRAALHRSLDNDRTETSDGGSSAAPGASSSDDVATETASAPTTGMNTRSSSGMEVLRTDFDISATGDLFWSNTADYLTLNRRLFDATRYIMGRQRDLVLEISRSMLDLMCKATVERAVIER